MEFRSNGKFLLTSEYLVSVGAKSFALPLKYGQTTTVLPLSETVIKWESYQLGEKWFEAEIDPTTMEMNSCTDKEVGEKLMLILKQIKSYNPTLFITGHHIVNHTDFDRKWGLGTSSTLICNLSQWAGASPYGVLKKTFGGSGYDLACGIAKKPISYQIRNAQPIVTEIDYNPSFVDQLAFVYLGEKVSSEKGLSDFKTAQNFTRKDVKHFTRLTNNWLKCDTIEELEDLIQDSETRIGEILKAKPVKETRFKDYPYQVKSMGAWGGDFALVTHRGFDEAQKYFKKEGYSTIFAFNEMLLK